MKTHVQASGQHLTYQQHYDDRSRFQQAFQDLVTADPACGRGKLLDIGCGQGPHPCIQPIYDAHDVVDGVDPFPEEHDAYQGYAHRWVGAFEDSGIAANEYDMAISFNVVEHIENPTPFLEKVFEVLKPGGSYWLLTPHRNHPFPLLSRSIELVGLKPWFEKSNDGVNDYPAYYRMNCKSQIVSLGKQFGFSAANFHYHPCMQWDTYFPAMLRFAPNLYDRFVGLRLPPAMQIFMCQLIK
jgi:SAM-dependent methyltransferase